MSQTGSISKEFAEALVRVQGSIEGAKKDSVNPHLKNKYADLASCWDACRTALQNNNVAVLQWPEAMDVPGGGQALGVTTQLVYGPTGETIERSFVVPVKDPTNPQALGSSITYGRRYGLCSVLGICPDDDDGNAAAQAPRGRPKLGGALVPTAEQSGSQFDSSGWQNMFDAAKDLDSRKVTYKLLKASSEPEPGKTSLLSKWAELIKTESAKKETSEKTEVNTNG